MNISFQKALQSCIKNPKISIYRKGETIKVKNTDIYILLGGIIQSYKPIDRFRFNTLGLIFDHSLFGNFENSSLIYLGSSYYKCITNIKVIKLPTSRFFNILKNKPECGYIFIQMLNQRLIDTEKFLAIISHKEVGKRLAHFLLLLANYYGISTIVGVTINLYISHEAIAEILYTTRVTITRLMGEFRKLNFIQIQGRKIILLRPIALSNYLNLVS